VSNAQSKPKRSQTPRPESSWTARAGVQPSPLNGLSRTKPTINVSVTVRNEAERRLEEKTKPYRAGRTIELLTSRIR
jgi:hypothetical protein